MQASNLIRLLAEHKVAANLIMVLMILAGIWALKSLNYQLDPNQELAIEVSSNKLKEMNVSLNQLADKIRSLSRDVPSGTIGQGITSQQPRQPGLAAVQLFN